MKERINGCKDSLANMVIYYYMTLKESGHPDPIEEISKTVSEAIPEGEQDKFYIDKGSVAINPNKIIDDVILILKAEDVIRKNPMALRQVRESLAILKTLIKKVEQ